MFRQPQIRGPPLSFRIDYRFGIGNPDEEILSPRAFLSLTLRQNPNLADSKLSFPIFHDPNRLRLTSPWARSSSGGWIRRKVPRFGNRLADFPVGARLGASAMKNYLRVLKFAWAYRNRLFASILCALLAAMLWGLNFTSVFPFLKTLQTDQHPLEWINESIATTNQEIDRVEAEKAILAEKDKHLEGQPTDTPSQRKHVEKMRRELTADQYANESKLEALRRNLYYLQWAKKFVNDLLPSDKFITLVWVVMAVMVAVILKCLFEFLQDSLVASVINQTIYDLRNVCFAHVIRLDVEKFNEQGSAELMARFTNDMDSLSAGMKTLFGRVVAEPLRVVACVALACMISWKLTFMFLILVPLALLLLTRIGRTMKRATRKLLERMSHIFQILQEVFQGIRTVKGHTAEAVERRRFLVATREYRYRSNIVSFVDALGGPLVEVLGVAAVSGALLVGSYLVLRQKTELFGLQLTDRPMESAALIQLYIFLAAIADPVRKLSSVFTKIQGAFAASDRIFDLYDKTPKIAPNANGLRLEKAEGATLGLRIIKTNEESDPWPGHDQPTPFLRFNEVGFSYHTGVPILRDVSFEVRLGETIAVVGHNGSGKSTLFSLLPRFFDPDHGSIQLLGHDLRKYQLRSLRRMVGLVNQNATLFNGTIGENIAYGSKGASREMIEAAAKKAHAHEMILKLPNGYDTRVGEAGGKLSGGQRQRVCLARAILRNPPILLLDEFTSQSDPESEALIHKAMEDFVRNRTVFIITHRPGSVHLANRVLVLDCGKVAGFGSHADLLQSCVPYQKFFQSEYRRKIA